MLYAVIIKHPYRDFDYRVDIVNVPDTTAPSDIRRVIERQMLGPFEVIAITDKVNPNRDITKGIEELNIPTEKHIET
jgi:hypothetical protein